MNHSTIRRLLLAATALLVVALTTLAGTTAASAHSGEESYVYFEIFEDRIEGSVHFPISDLNQAAGLDLPEERGVVDTAVAEETDAIIAYANDHLSVADESGRESWRVVFDEDIRVIALSAGGYVVVPFAIDRQFDEVPQRFSVTYDGIIHELTQKSAFLLIANDWEGGQFNNESSQLGRFTAGDTTQIVDRDASFWKGFLTVIGLGTEHIEIGTDHILFVLALVLPAVLVFTRGEGWRAIPTFGGGLWRVTKIATMFTLAHSVTLTLGGLDIIPLNPRPVEVLIALSIAAAAIHNFYPVFANREWILAFCFGLFHGMGFAGLLEELGLDGSNRVWSLLGFNIGIELGQLVIIFLVFPVLFLLRRTPVYPVLLYGSSAVLAVVASGWAMERAFDLPDRVNPLVDPLLAWPRAGWIVVGLGVVAAVYNRWVAANGGLRDLDAVLPGPAIQRRGGRRPQPPTGVGPAPQAPPGDEVLQTTP